MTDTHETTKKDALTRIREGAVHMRSKNYFYLKLAVVAAIASLALLVSIFIFNFILFSIFAEHRAPLLGYGPPGYLVFLQMFPWPLLIVDVLLLIGLRMLLRRFEFGYRSPTLYLLFGVLVVVGALGFVLYEHTDVNDRIEREAHKGHFPTPVKDFFDDAHRPAPPRGTFH